MIRPAISTTDVALRRFSHAHVCDERQTYPLLAHRSPEDCVAWRRGKTFSRSAFLAAVAELASRLPAKRHAINLCKDRYHFVVGFAAALVARQISLLPTCRADEPLQQLYHRYPDAYVLTDHSDVPADLPSFVISDDLLTMPRHTDNPSIPANRIAAIVFTSGSSGLPTAHAKSWGALAKGAHALGRQFDLADHPARIAVGTVPAQHMYGLETTIMLPLQWGWSIHAGNPVLPADIRSDLQDLTLPAWLMTTPVHLRAYVGERATLPGLEGIISATMPLAPSLARTAERLWGVPVHEMYGCTEGGVIATRRTTANELWQLCHGLRMRQDDEAVWVTGGHVGECLRLTDRITMRKKREFVLHGPSHDLVKVAGKRASLAALNAALIRVPGVLDGTFYWPDQGRTGSGRLSAFVVAPGLDRSPILAELRKRIDPVFLPRPLRFVDALPRNAMGKLPREHLDAWAANLTARDRDPEE